VALLLLLRHPSEVMGRCISQVELSTFKFVFKRSHMRGAHLSERDAKNSSICCFAHSRGPHCILQYRLKINKGGVLPIFLAPLSLARSLIPIGL
jgi:hypothetical protein